MKRLDWDSDFFGFDVYEGVFKKGETLPFGMIYLYGKYDELESLKTDYYPDAYLENKVEFAKWIRRKEKAEHFDNIKPVESFSDKLFDLAKISGQHSRFKCDNKLQPYFNRLYKLWVVNSINKRIASTVLGYYDNDNLVGFITLKLTGVEAKVGLFAVDSEFQGKGIGKKLLISAENWVSKNGGETMVIATQGKNINACYFYKKNGYVLLTSVFLLQIINSSEIKVID